MFVHYNIFYANELLIIINNRYDCCFDNNYNNYNNRCIEQSILFIFKRENYNALSDILSRPIIHY